MKMRLNLLFTPGDNPILIQAAQMFGCDALVYNLGALETEDLNSARYLVKYALKDLDAGVSERIVFIGDIAADGKKDLSVVISGAPDAILIDNVSSSEIVNNLASMLSTLEQEHSLPEGSTEIIPIINEHGLAHISDIAKANQRVTALMCGETLTHEDQKAQIVKAAREAGLQALESSTGDLRDMEGMKTSCQRLKRIGFDGTGIIHPAQNKSVFEAFAPSQEDINLAQILLNSENEIEKRRAQSMLRIAKLKEDVVEWTLL